jgi:hypothetical protein
MLVLFLYLVGETPRAVLSLGNQFLSSQTPSGFAGLNSLTRGSYQPMEERMGLGNRAEQAGCGGREAVGLHIQHCIWEALSLT